MVRLSLPMAVEGVTLGEPAERFLYTKRELKQPGRPALIRTRRYTPDTC